MSSNFLANNFSNTKKDSKLTSISESHSPQSWIVDNIKSLIGSSSSCKKNLNHDDEDDENDLSTNSNDCTLISLRSDASYGNKPSEVSSEDFEIEIEKSRTLKHDFELDNNNLLKRPFSPENIQPYDAQQEFNFQSYSNSNLNNFNAAQSFLMAMNMDAFQSQAQCQNLMNPTISNNNNNKNNKNMPKLTSSNSSSSISSLSNYLHQDLVPSSSATCKKKRLNQSVSGSSLMPSSNYLPRLSLTNEADLYNSLSCQSNNNNNSSVSDFIDYDYSSSSFLTNSNLNNQCQTVNSFNNSNNLSSFIDYGDSSEHSLNNGSYNLQPKYNQYLSVPGMTMQQQSSQKSLLKNQLNRLNQFNVSSSNAGSTSTSTSTPSNHLKFLHHHKINNLDDDEYLPIQQHQHLQLQNSHQFEENSANYSNLKNSHSNNSISSVDSMSNNDHSFSQFNPRKHQRTTSNQFIPQKQLFEESFKLNQSSRYHQNQNQTQSQPQQAKITKSSTTLFNQQQPSYNLQQQQQQQQAFAHSTSYDNIGNCALKCNAFTPITQHAKQYFNKNDHLDSSFYANQKWSHPQQHQFEQQQQQQHVAVTPSNPQSSKDLITLHVKNLDYKISSDEWKRILLENFRKHCKEIVSVNVVTNADKSLLGIVKLGSKDDARLAISSLHHKKIGYKRLNVNIAFSPSTSSPKSKIVALLKSSSDTNEMLLTRFIELYEQRYNQTITVSELFKLKDIVYITQSKDGQGRLIKLSCRNYQNNLENEMQELLHQPYCSLHSQRVSSEKEGFLPNVIVSLRAFKSAVHKLLNDHGGQMPLLSFMDCYKCCILNQNQNQNQIQIQACQSQFSAAEMHNSYLLLIDNENGVSLEHLITCAQDVQIQYNEGFYKQLKWENDKTKSTSLQSKTGRKPSTNELCDLTTIESFGDQDQFVEESQRKLNQFSHEVVELFKGVQKCVIPLSKFNNEYHKKYGRQCRVADYGYTKLYELLESIPHIIQILDGEFEKKLTLTHRVQVRRFSNDLLKALKSHSHKQMFADEFPQVFEKHFGKQFDIRDYGVCYLEDMLAELPESIICRKEIEGRTFIQIPKVVQDDDEILCTHKLKADIIDMLKLRPRFSIQFNKFIPNFHHHFGRQCKLSNYGFTKLIELLEAMPNTVQIFTKDSVQFVQLKKELMFDLICQNLVKILEENNMRLKMSLAKLEEIYNSKYENIYFQDFECNSFQELFSQLPLDSNFIQAEKFDSEICLSVESLNEREVKRTCKFIVKRLMDDLEDCVMKRIKNLVKFQELWDFLLSANNQDMASLIGKIPNNRSFQYAMKCLNDYFLIESHSDRLESDSCISGLSDFYYFAKHIRNLYKQTNLLDMSFVELELVYKQKNSVGGFPYKRFGYIDTFLMFSQGLNLIVTIKKYQNDKRICLNREFWPKSVLDSNANPLSDSFSSPLSPPKESGRQVNTSLTPSQFDMQVPRRGALLSSSSDYQQHYLH